MIEYLNWASSLVGVTPPARLLAMLMANNSSRGELSLDRALNWIGCSQSELLLAMSELRSQGVLAALNDAGLIEFELPQVVELSTGPKATRDTLSIYVIALSAAVSKIGVSRNTQLRLANLQAANPVQRYSIAWQFSGPSDLIRRAEWLAHKELAEQALGNEWFAVTTDRAIDVARASLLQVGLGT